MTIAIAAYGPNAGGAVLDGVRAAEVLGRGAIGGFAVFSTLDTDGAHRQSVVQRGGIGAMDYPAQRLDATCAAIISSGPDRPEPLSQFLTGRAGLGLVTGHRLPNRPGSDGAPANRAVLEIMAEGGTPANAIAAVLGANPELDAGIIAVRPGGPLAAGNSARVDRRDDGLGAIRQDASRGFAMLCNSIYSMRGVVLEEVVGDVVWSVLGDAPSGWPFVSFNTLVNIRRAGHDRVHLDLNGRVTLIECSEPNIGTGGARVTVVHLGAEVWQNNTCIGKSLSEVFAVVADGRATVAGQGADAFIVERTRHVAT